MSIFGSSSSRRSSNRCLSAVCRRYFHDRTAETILARCNQHRLSQSTIEYYPVQHKYIVHITIKKYRDYRITLANSLDALRLNSHNTNNIRLVDRVGEWLMQAATVGDSRTRQQYRIYANRYRQQVIQMIQRSFPQRLLSAH
jgi:hypothetical protein